MESHNPLSARLHSAADEVAACAPLGEEEMTDFQHLYAPGAAALAQILEPIAAACGYRLVRLRLAGSILQVMAECLNQQSFSHADCARLSRALESALAETDAHAPPARLEVSSPGLARPLVCAADFASYKGRHVAVRLAAKQAGRRRHEGILLGLKDGQIGLRVKTASDDAPDGDTPDNAEGTILHFAPKAVMSAELVPEEQVLRQNLRQARRARKTAANRKGAAHGNRN